MRRTALLFALFVVLIDASMAQAQRYTVLYNFPDNENSSPQCPLIEITPGVYYGGSQDTLFSITPAGVFTPLFTFDSTGPLGAGPEAGVIEASNGTLYGVTYLGAPSGGGAVFKSDLAGNVTTLNTQVYHSTPLTEGLDGNLYGITGSATGDFSFFRLTPEGVLTPLYDLGPYASAANQLLLADDGNFYGATPLKLGDHGVVYRLTPNGDYTVIHEFPVTEAAVSPLMQASNGLIYGAFDGGFRCDTPDHGNGIFTLSLSGEYNVINVFTDCFGYGGDVTSGLVEGSDGQLYGFDEAQNDVLGSEPFIFVMSLAGGNLGLVQTLDLYIGSGPYTYGPAFVQGSDGNFYVTNESGGTGVGTVLQLALGLPVPLPRVAIFEPKSGQPGTPVRIKGSHLVGLSAVSFNGTPAKFVSEGNGYANAIVPAGAVSGPITVTTMNGSATSKSSFEVQ